MSKTVLFALCLLATILYALAFALPFVCKRRFRTAAELCHLGGTLLSGAIVVYNWIVNGYVPFVSMYQVLTFLALTCSFVYLYIRFLCEGAWMRRYFCLAQAVIMTGVCCMDQSVLWAFPPALQSAYFIPHVLSYMIAYTLTAVAAILCVVRPLQPKETRAQYAQGIYDLVRIGFPFTVLGLLLGALWANACWGNYWSWDLKEAWALVTVLSLAVYLHFRRQERLRRYAEIFVVLALLFEIITLLCVGMFGGDSIHAYS